MTKRKSNIFLGILAASLLLTPSASAAERKVGVVLESEIHDRHDPQVIHMATQAFVESRSFEVVERAQLEKVIEEQNLQSFTGENIQVLGDIAGIDYLALVSYTVEGESTSTGTHYDYAVSCRLVDARSGKVTTSLHSEDPGWKKILRNPFGQSGAVSAADRLTLAIRQEFPVEGYVIKTVGEEIVVDLGEAAGVQKGDVLAVIQQSEPILHPVTREEIPGEEREVAQLKVQSASDDVSICKLKGKGTAPRLGDRVRFKK